MSRFDANTTALAGSLVRIDGGWHVKTLDNGLHIQVREMLYNFRVLLAEDRGDPRGEPWPIQGYCYFGHGQNSSGEQRSMKSAFTRAVLAAIAWDGEGEPAGHDKRAF